MSDEVRFADGNLSGTVRVGETVRRRSGPWTSAVHALLRYLERAGFDGSPRVLGFDSHGREVLSFVEGETMPASLEGYGSDSALVSVAGLLSRYHEAVKGFLWPDDAAWRYQSGAPRQGGVVCHNDVSPWNTVIRGGRAVALVDWDYAAPGPAEWDVAHALWRFAPLYADETFGPPAERARRMRLFCDAYGLSQSRGAGLLDLVERRQLALYDTLVEGAAAGESAFAALLRDGHGDGIMGDLAYVRRFRRELDVR